MDKEKRMVGEVGEHLKQVEIAHHEKGHNQLRHHEEHHTVNKLREQKL